MKEIEIPKDLKIPEGYKISLKESIDKKFVIIPKEKELTEEELVEKRNKLIEKLYAFECIVWKLLEWYKEANPDKEDNDLSILKVMKLLFFVSGVDKENHLFDVFDRFQAWQYGHVEADIYDYYSTMNGKFRYCTIDRNHTVFHANPFEN